MAITAESYAKAEANSANLVACKISWGRFVMENQAIVNQRRAELLSAGEEHPEEPERVSLGSLRRRWNRQRSDSKQDLPSLRG